MKTIKMANKIIENTTKIGSTVQKLLMNKVENFGKIENSPPFYDTETIEMDKKKIFLFMYVNTIHLRNELVLQQKNRPTGDNVISDLMKKSKLIFFYVLFIL